jgi:hypothetical protein
MNIIFEQNITLFDACTKNEDEVFSSSILIKLARLSSYTQRQGQIIVAKKDRPRFRIH